MNSTNINSEFEFEFKMEIQNGKEKEIKKRGREATWASDPISAQNPLLTRVSRPIPPQPLGLTLTAMWANGAEVSSIFPTEDRTQSVAPVRNLGGC
jgi:hypothetical protein